MIRLVINADDLGMDPAIDEGILRAKREGLVTSATVLVRGRNAAAAVPRAVKEGLALGVHLCLSTDFPCAAPADEVPTVAPGGRLRAAWADFARDWMLRRVRPEEVERELRAQVARARELGAKPDHLDGHQHLHVLPGISQIVWRIAREENLAVRWPWERPQRGWLSQPGPAAKAALLTGLAAVRRPAGVRTVRGVGVFETNRLDEGTLCGILERLRPGDYDLCAHPGLNPKELPEDPGWATGRERELAALCSARARAVAHERGIQLTTYGALSQQ